MGNFIGPILPIIALILLGKWCRQTQYISPNSIGEIKKFLLNICMVCTLLNIVLFMEITSESILVIVISYIMLCLFLIAGKLCNLLPALHHKFTPYVCSGTAFMLVGMALFSMIYGNDNLAIFSFIGVGHEIFIWTIYYIWFRIDTSGQKFDLSIVKNLLKSPFIITIILGTILNIFDVGYILQSHPIGQGILQSIDSLSSIASPFVLVCLGYGLVLDVKYIKESLKLVFARYLVALTIGYLFKFLVIDNIITPSPIINASFAAFIMLPPMFTLTLFINDVATTEEVEIINGAIGISTIISVILFIILSIIIPYSSLV